MGAGRSPRPNLEMQPEESWNFACQPEFIPRRKRIDCYMTAHRQFKQREGFYDSDIISAGQISEILPASSPGGPQRESTSGTEFIFVKNGPIEVSGGRGSIQNEKLVWMKQSTPFSKAARNQHMQKTTNKPKFQVNKLEKHSKIHQIIPLSISP